MEKHLQNKEQARSPSAWTGADGKQYQPFKAYLDNPKKKDKLDQMNRWLAADGVVEEEQRAKKRQRVEEKWETRAWTRRVCIVYIIEKIKKKINK